MLAGRTLLAGDAAHLVAPFGARGLNTGVFDAENAAWKIAYALRGWAGPGLLESYDAERVAAARENLEVTATTMRFLAPQTEAARRDRERLLLAAAADPAAAASVESGRFAEPFWYVSSPLTTPDPARPFPGRPARGTTPTPAPGILVPDSPVTAPGRPGVTRLRELLRDGYAVLLGDADELAAVRQAVSRATAAPVQVIAASGLGGGSDVIGMLTMRAGEAWIIRPDAYVAAVVPAADTAAVTAALRRALGY
jgi:3-(3-hydroxy-phenyl)propionate hydroxylase